MLTHLPGNDDIRVPPAGADELVKRGLHKLGVLLNHTCCKAAEAATQEGKGHASAWGRSANQAVVVIAAG